MPNLMRKISMQSSGKSSYSFFLLKEESEDTLRHEFSPTISHSRLSRSEQKQVCFFSRTKRQKFLVSKHTHRHAAFSFSLSLTLLTSLLWTFPFDFFGVVVALSTKTTICLLHAHTYTHSQIKKSFLFFSQDLEGYFNYLKEVFTESVPSCRWFCSEYIADKSMTMLFVNCVNLLFRRLWGDLVLHVLTVLRPYEYWFYGEVNINILYMCIP